MRAAAGRIVAAAMFETRFGKVLDGRDALGDVGDVLAWHGLGSALQHVTALLSSFYAWADLIRHTGHATVSRVSRIDRGRFFVDLAEGIEGQVHINEMPW